jgi:two-component system, OmpR family, alkaline phosphatase synthesis response regulator PhoP
LPLRILLVDDDEAFRSVTAIALETEGCIVKEAADGFAALESLQRDHPDVLICDLNMPGLDGRELCHRVRMNPGLADVRVVILSALIEPDGSGIPPNIEADCCISKQAHFSQLVTRIAALTRA